MTPSPETPSSVPKIFQNVSDFSPSRNVAMTPAIRGASPNITEIRPECTKRAAQ